MTCTCQTISAPPEIRQCPEHFHFWYGDRRLMSVGSLIKAVYPRKTFDGVPEHIIENARIRGSLIDRYASEYLRTGNVTVAPGEREDVLAYLDRVIPWLDQNVRGPVEVQKIVYSVKDGVAATMDFFYDDTVLDLKAVSELQPSYKIQLGCHAEYAPAKRTAILHVTKKDIRRVDFDRDQCVGLFQGALVWYEQIREMEG